jgi:O-antigen ligase
MAFIQNSILILCFFSFFIGQLFRLNLFGISFPLIDISIILLTGFNLVFHLKNKSLKINNKYFFYFIIYAWILLLFSYFRFQTFSLNSLFYLTRFTCLLSLFILPLKVNQKQHRLFYLFVIANIIFGFIQYFFWPDFTYFDVNQWDPHLYRLVSTFFDPTFTGLIYLLFFITIYFNKKIPYRKFLLIISYLAIALTYSRSTYLSFVGAFAFISISTKKIRPFLISLIIILITILCLPRQPGEGTKLERTSSITAKIQNYQEGLTLFTKHPIFGIGYNNISEFRENKNPSSHANSGFDGSILTLLISTGIIGTTLFLLGSKNYYRFLPLSKKTLTWIILIHSLFANSLLYPWTLLSLIFL